jgi:glutaminyl-tRNA synthetase
LWIERDDFMEQPSKGYHRLHPGNTGAPALWLCRPLHRLRARRERGRQRVHCEYLPDSKSGTPGADAYKVKGNLHWVAVADACRAEVRLYDRLFAVPSPGARRDSDPEGAERDFRDDLNPDSIRVIEAWLEPALKNARAEERFQFERHGYFVADRVDSKQGAPVFNRTVTLRDSWSTRSGQHR